MRELADKCPKVWKMCMQEEDNSTEEQNEFYLSFGYFILVFFPKYRIYIDIEFHTVVGLPVFTVHQAKGQQDKDAAYFKTPEEAVLRAGELLEKKLNEKLS